MPKTPTLSPGGALRIRRHDESGGPELVTVSSAVARRAEYVREQYLTDPGGDERNCAVFKDPRTEEWYGQPLSEED